LAAIPPAGGDSDEAAKWIEHGLAEDIDDGQGETRSDRYHHGERDLTPGARP
jgi:hypothetical protein